VIDPAQGEQSPCLPSATANLLRGIGDLAGVELGPIGSSWERFRL
jgi:hypothetical protein